MKIHKYMVQPHKKEGSTWNSETLTQTPTFHTQLINKAWLENEEVKG